MKGHIVKVRDSEGKINAIPEVEFDSSLSYLHKNARTGLGEDRFVYLLRFFR